MQSSTAFMSSQRRWSTVLVLLLWWSTKIPTWYESLLHKPNSRGPRRFIPSSSTLNHPRLSIPRLKISWLLFKDSRVGQAPVTVHCLKTPLRILDRLCLMLPTTTVMKQVHLLGGVVRVWQRMVQLFHAALLIWILLICHFSLQIPPISFAHLVHQCLNILIPHMGFWEVWYPLLLWNSWNNCLNIDTNSAWSR